MSSPPFLKYGQEVIRPFSALLHLFYPRLCLACNNHLPPQAELLCLFCQRRLPLTGYHLLPENPFTERFWGRLPLYSGTALYHFSKGGRVQHLIHQLKYHHRPEIGYELGKLHGSQLRAASTFAGVELIVPVPLHPKKRHQRGYNQSDQYARGLAEGMQVKWSADVLAREAYTATQTQKSRLERFENVGEVFRLHRPDQVSGRHVLLVDDVITTGATLEACGLVLLKAGNVRLSIATIGFAS